MAKEKNTVPQAPSQPASNVRNYFTKEINEQISGMSPKEMENLMKDIIGNRQWIAILKYTGLRTLLLDSSLRTINPSEDPHSISWSQGALAGLCDIENYVIDLNAPKVAQEEPEEGQPVSGKPEGVIIG